MSRGLAHHEALRREGDVAAIPWPTFMCWASNAADQACTRRALRAWIDHVPMQQRPSMRPPTVGTVGRIGRRPALGETQLARAVQHYLLHKYLREN